MERPAWSAVVELLKPITWFPPMWAFLCGVVSSGATPSGKWQVVFAGVLLAGPLVCATSQAVNDWFDRFVDAVNEPQRPIPSGRLPGRWGLYIALFWTLLSLLVATTLGPWVFYAAVIGLGLAWAYSAPPLRLKRNGWYGNAVVAACYEGLPWLTGAAVMASHAAAPAWPVIALAVLYSIGAHGIMTLNDFKSIKGDQRMGIGSLPVRLGEQRAAQVACIVMAVPQVVVVGLLLYWDEMVQAVVVSLLLLAQTFLMQQFLRDPQAQATRYSAQGVSLYVLGMLVSASAAALTGVVVT